MSEVVLSFHGIEESLRGATSGATLLVSKKNPRVQKLIDLANKQSVSVREVTDSELVRACDGAEHRGAVLLLPESRKTKETNWDDFLNSLENEQALVVLLDGVTDPQNYGAILRSADQFGADLVVIPSRRSASDTPAVFASSAGAAAWVPHCVVTNLTRSLDQLKEKGFWIYGADMNGVEASMTKLTGRTAIVLGSEGKGISRLVREHCDQIVSIPTQGKLDSLNVSVSAGILMYEVRRQQRAAASK